MAHGQKAALRLLVFCENLVLDFTWLFPVRSLNGLNTS